MKTKVRTIAGSSRFRRTGKGLDTAKFLLLTLLLGWGLGFVHPAGASDPVGIYVIADKVVLEPKDGSPERVQIWGAISLAEGHGSTYAAATNGYLYFKLKPGKEETCLKEWKDLQSVAGTGQIVGFASRYQEKGVVRKTDAPAQNPDIYPIGFGVVKIGDGQRSDFKTFRELRQLRPIKGKEAASAGSAKGDEKKK